MHFSCSSDTLHMFTCKVFVYNLLRGTFMLKISPKVGFVKSLTGFVLQTVGVAEDGGNKAALMHL